MNGCVLALFLILGMQCFAQVQVPAPKPGPAAAPIVEIQTVVPMGTLLMIADVDCEVFVDTKPFAKLTADNPHSLPLMEGKHLLVAKDAEGKLIYEIPIVVAENIQSAVQIVPIVKEVLSASVEEQPRVIKELPTGVLFVKIPAGKMKLGCRNGDRFCRPDEKHNTDMEIKKAFWIMDSEVTVGQFEEFANQTRGKMPTQPRWNQTAHPVVNVLWDEATKFCKWLGARLPTEMEWEFAARSGTSGQKFPLGDEIDRSQANFGSEHCCSGASSGKDRWVNTAPVKSFAQTGVGLYDMLGNAAEWTADNWRENPTLKDGPVSSILYSVRGGSWLTPSRELRLSSRNQLATGYRFDDTGFRCAADTLEVK